MHNIALIGIGSNLTNDAGHQPVHVCRAAICDLVSFPQCRLAKHSSWYRSAPIPRSDQPDYINGVVEMMTVETPLALLHRLQNIEMMAGRVRSVPNAARVLDLDILAYDDLVWSGPELTLPHPRMTERAFVMQPLSEIAPDWMHPVLHLSAAALCSRSADQEIERLP